MHEFLLCCESSLKCHHAAQTTPTWTKTILSCFTTFIAVQPSMTKYELTMYQMKVEELCYHAPKSVLLHLFSILRNLESNLGFLSFFSTHTVHSKNTWVNVNRKRVHRGRTHFRVKSDPEFSQLSAYSTNNEVKLTPLWWVIFRGKLTTNSGLTRACRDRVCPNGPFLVMFGLCVFRVYIG